MTLHRVDPDRPSITYGPRRGDGDVWVLSINTAQDRLDLVLDKEAMYELWTEVQHVPWPRGPEPKGRLVREIVERIKHLDAESCEEILEAAKRETGELRQEGSA